MTDNDKIKFSSWRNIVLDRKVSRKMIVQCNTFISGKYDVIHYLLASSLMIAMPTIIMNLQSLISRKLVRVFSGKGRIFILPGSLYAQKFRCSEVVYFLSCKKFL